MKKNTEKNCNFHGLKRVGIPDPFFNSPEIRFKYLCKLPVGKLFFDCFARADSYEPTTMNIESCCCCLT